MIIIIQLNDDRLVSTTLNRSGGKGGKEENETIIENLTNISEIPQIKCGEQVNHAHWGPYTFFC